MTSPLTGYRTADYSSMKFVTKYNERKQNVKYSILPKGPYSTIGSVSFLMHMTRNKPLWY